MAVRCGTVLTGGSPGGAAVERRRGRRRAGHRLRVSFPRNETLYTSGSAYSPPTNSQPPQRSRHYTGVQGLLYETLFLYDTHPQQYIPWLASSGRWTSSNTYVINVRPGVKWSDGTPLTSADVAYTINLAKANPAVGYSNLGPSLAGAGAVASGNTVTVHFTNPAPYGPGPTSCGTT